VEFYILSQGLCTLPDVASDTYPVAFLPKNLHELCRGLGKTGYLFLPLIECLNVFHGQIKGLSLDWVQLNNLLEQEEKMHMIFF
jgi:hypothetical protein